MEAAISWLGVPSAAVSTMQPCKHQGLCALLVCGSLRAHRPTVSHSNWESSTLHWPFALSPDVFRSTVASATVRSAHTAAIPMAARKPQAAAMGPVI